jgi:Flp pilus assembly protein TadB
VSRERARRRAAREAEAAQQRRVREVERRREQARAALVGSVSEPATRIRTSLSRWWRRTYPPGDPFARRRRREMFVVLLLGLLVQVVSWWFIPSWAGRAVVLVLTLFLLPVLRVVLYDRR